MAQVGAKSAKIKPNRSKREQTLRKMEQDRAKVGENWAQMRQHEPKRGQKGAQGRASEGDARQTLANKDKNWPTRTNICQQGQTFGGLAECAVVLGLELDKN